MVKPPPSSSSASASVSGSGPSSARALDASQGEELLAAAALGNSSRLQQLLTAGAAINFQNSEGVSALYLASREGNLEAVRQLLGAGADTSLANAMAGKVHCGETPLIVAARGGRADVVAALLDSGANPNLVKVSGNVSPLFIAAQEDRVEVARLLVDRKADVDLSSRNGTTPLMMAARRGHVRVVELLLERRANVMQVKDEGETPLSLAVTLGQAAVVKVLLGAKADADHSSARMPGALHAAVEFERLEMVRVLLDHGADVDHSLATNVTPLMRACIRELPDIVELLLDRGASITKIGNNNLSAIQYAAATKGIRAHKIVQLLLAAKASANTATEVSGAQKSVLEIAARLGTAATVQLLLQAKADPNFGAEEGLDTPLLLAAERGELECVSSLLGAKADVNGGKASKAKNPIVGACLRGHHKVVACLLQNGASVNSPKAQIVADSPMHSPISAACEAKSTECVAVLLANKANPNGTLPDGRPLLVAAVRNGSMTELFLKHKADIGFSWGDSASGPLHYAAHAACAAAIHALIARGAAVNGTTSQGCTPLFYALSANSSPSTTNNEAARMLISAKADVNHRTSTGLTPLLCARRYHDVVLLIKFSADMNAKSDTGVTPLQLACERGQVDIAEYLVRENDNTMCDEYMTAVQKARVRSQPLASWMLAVRGFNGVHWACEQNHAKILLDLLRDDLATTADVCAESWSGLTPLQVAMRHGTHDVFPAGRGQVRLDSETIKIIAAAAQPWSPLRHYVWPRTFRQGVFTILCVAHRLATCANRSIRQRLRNSTTYSGAVVGASDSPAESSINDARVDQQFAVLCREQTRVALPFDMWCTILSFCSREHWFCNDGI